MLLSQRLPFLRLSPARTRLARVGGNVNAAVAPRVLAFTTFLAGVILLFSGATPAKSGRIGWINDVLPVPVVELSAYFASVAGVALILLARGLQRRLDAAYHLTLWVLAGGILFSLTSALDVEQAVLLGIMFAALLRSRRFFYRRSSLFEERFTRGWYIAIAGVLAATAALAYLAYGHDVTSTDVFWEFSDAQAPRAVRALTLAVVAVVAILGLSLSRLLSSSRSGRIAVQADRAVVESIVRASPRANAHLALLGDKEFLFDEAHSGFLMIGTAGESRIVMGDPVGPLVSAASLVDTFIRDCDREGSSPVFYRVGPQLLYLYLDYGLTVVKLGEVARVPLRDFSLDGPQRRNLRRVWRKLVDGGCSFELVSREQVIPLLPELRSISQQWLEQKRASEKGFSLGRFDESFVADGPIGIVRVGGRIVAFGTAWLSGERAEVEIDLMRYSTDAPPGAMRFLLVEFMLWARREGYAYFNLGMVPLSGIRTGSIAPLWNQVVGAVRIGGERYYNFQGLREFKAWFYPEWEPSYLVSPGGAKRPRIIANIASLISGGAGGVLSKGRASVRPRK
ncbi:MAG: phosphatidylglycerol lysyltransferase domain-containing protein [Gemmatimonadaceae bacterium]